MTVIDRIARAARAFLAPDVPLALPAPEPRRDSLVSLPSLWSNAYTGLGGTDKDRTTWHVPGAIQAIDDETLAALWQGDPIARTVIEAIVDDGMRAGFQVCYHGETEADSKRIADVTELVTELGLEDAVRLAAKSARALRGGGLLISTNGGRMLASRPLDDERVTSVDRVVVWDSRSLRVASWRYDRHLQYWYSPVNQSELEEEWGSQIHASHAVVFQGIDTSLRDRVETWEGWYRPVLQHVVEKIREYTQSWQSTVAMLQDGSQGVLSLPGLSQIIAGGGRALLETRLSLIQLYRWVGRIMPIDAGTGGQPGEDFRWVERGYAGIADLLNAHQPVVAQAADMPLPRLFGDFSSSGLNNAGAGAERNWYSAVASWRRGHIQPGLERIVRLLAKQAGARDWRRFGIEWPELEVLSSGERAALEKAEAETDDIRIGQGMPPEVVLRHRYGQGEYSHSPPLLTEEDLDDIVVTAKPESEPDRPVAIQTGEGTTPEQVAANAVPPDTALNGAQVSSLKEIVLAVANREMPRQSGVEMIITAFPVDRSAAERIMGEVGKSFFAATTPEPTAKQPPPPQPVPAEEPEEEPAEEEE